LPILRIACAAACLLAAQSAYAQRGDAPLPDPQETGADRVTIGVGAAYGPDYEGSDDYRFIPGLIIQGQAGGISFVTRGLGLYVDLVPKFADRSISFEAGPILGIRLSRTGSVDDPIVNLLPDRKTGIEVGGFAGASIGGLTNPYDKLSLRFDAVTDINGAYSGLVYGPTITYATPLSRRTYVSASASLDFASGDFASTYFGVSPTESLLVPSLPAYDPDGGLKDWKLGLLVAHALGKDDLLDGWQLFGTVSYKKLVGDFADSPLVADRGEAGQWFVATGVGYSF